MYLVGYTLSKVTKKYMEFQEALKQNPELSLGEWKWGNNYEDYDEDYE